MREWMIANHVITESALEQLEREDKEVVNEAKRRAFEALTQPLLSDTIAEPRGEVTLTDASGQTVRLLPGDSYLIKQDSLIFWQVARNFVQKSFFSVVEE